MKKVTSKQTVVLIIEDSDDDYETAKLALREAKLENPIHRCDTGEEALDYLSHVQVTRREQLPGIILLDLKLPGMSGNDVLKKIKADQKLRVIPVVILSTSIDDRDIKASYESGANSYMAKPVNLDTFIQSIIHLKEYWFDITILPERTKAFDGGPL